MPSVQRYERKQIAVMGRCGVGKSSLVRVLSGKDKNIPENSTASNLISNKQVMELLPFGPLILLDTIGIDIDGELGEKRVSDTIKTISSMDLVILVLDARENLSGKEWELLNYLDKINVPYIIAVNKIEYGVNPVLLSEIKLLKTAHYEISCAENVGIDSLKTKVMRMLPQSDSQPFISDIVSQGDVVVLVVPNDLNIRKRRQIIPQIQTIKEALDEDTTVVITKEKELRSTLYTLKNSPDLVLIDNQSTTDSFSEVSDDMKLTTFSILNARNKGDLQTFIKGLKAVETLKDKDEILIVEACNHHNRNYNIGREEIKKWLELISKKKLIIDFHDGMNFPSDLTAYKLIVYCSGCTLTRKTMQAKIKEAISLDIPIVNYDTFISYKNGLFPRVLFPFEEALAEWENPL